MNQQLQDRIAKLEVIVGKMFPGQTERIENYVRDIVYDTLVETVGFSGERVMIILDDAITGWEEN